MKIKMKSKKIRGVMSAAALLLALTLPPAAHGQSDGPFSNANGKSDGFFSNAGGVRNGDGNGAAWNGMDDETPVGGGLLVLALSGVCYAGAKRMKGERLKGRKVERGK